MAPTAQLLADGWQRHRAGNLAGAEQLYRQALQAEAENANAWCYLGMVLHDQAKHDEAIAAYQNAIRIRPRFPEALNNLGNSLSARQRLDEALACFDQALRIKPNYLQAIKNKAKAQIAHGRLDEALACNRQILKANPDDAETLRDEAMVLFWSGRMEEATACFHKMLTLRPDDALAHKNLGHALLQQGNFEDGWREYEWRRKAPDYPQPRWTQPLWDGSQLKDRTILLTAEQGLGDTIHFIRYAAVLKERFDCRVVVACQAALLPLLQNCSGIDALVSQQEAPPPFDVYAPLPSLPGILHDTPATFPGRVPYLRPDEALVQRWREELKDQDIVKIGIVWQGSRTHGADLMRSASLREFLPLSKLRGVRWFALQKGHGVEQLETVSDWKIDPLGDRLDQSGGAFMDTAAVLANLDLLISVDTSVAHVAGAIGTPVWLALSHVADWRWLHKREDTPWYPQTRLFRQSRTNDWPGVFERMAEELIQRFPGKIGWKSWEEYRLSTGKMNCLSIGRHGLNLYNRHDSYIGRSLERYGEFSEGEVELFRQMVRPSCVVVEAGANFGAHTLVFSQLVGETGTVYAFEPQRLIFQALCANMALNSRTNVHCFCEALGDRPGSIVVPTLDYRKAANFGGVALGGQAQGEKVAVLTIDGLALPRCDFLKADVEGMELSVLQGATDTLRKHRPILYVENDRQEKSAALIEYLLSMGYDLYWHLPRMFDPRNYYHNPVNEFGKIVSVNMLGIHSSVKSSLAGFRRVTGPLDNWRTPPASR